jgi:hypothetical protein
MPKITIYVSDDLKSEMDKAEAQKPNWSAIAQEVFELECHRIANRKKGGGKMNEVIERLRKSKENKSNQDRIRGHAAGRNWAMSRAEYDELERLSEFEFQYETEDLAWDVAIAIAGDVDQARDRNLWEEQVGIPNPSDAFVEAFVEGAGEVFDEVSPDL